MAAERHPLGPRPPVDVDLFVSISMHVFLMGFITFLGYGTIVFDGLGGFFGYSNGDFYWAPLTIVNQHHAAPWVMMQLSLTTVHHH